MTVKVTLQLISIYGDLELPAATLRHLKGKETSLDTFRLNFLFVLLSF